ncbi:glycosyltransferase family 4 protein [Flexibacterium corallicola]|uniref:glycosyltransferase family 4 protein n=1 Tax=Flexibacterium corallicola TaxID=3037259 RepID=UPI00286F6CF9|nr:glycosyltransferase family 4 protein [Pseudovibrio sp. M1P-2-3]
MQIDNFVVEPFPCLTEFTDYKSSAKMRICIATEEILGPVRNGGIASTYYHLAKGLVAHGHEVHVLYLKGEVVENETPQHWVDHFASFGVSLHYLIHTTAKIIGPSQQWQQRYGAAYAWLKEQDRFDIIHSSEWRGGLIYALMAKKLGLAFQDTLFIIKTSSPHIWNRHYQMQPIAKKELLPACFAEQKCVELGDMVIGGSAHLLCFMKHVGYKLPKATYVQPNILDFSEVPVTDLRPIRKAGDIVYSKEITFFGRLEMRKGIELFCNALDLLERDGVLPNTVNFLGKYGEALPNQKNEKVEAYIKRKAAAWSFKVNYFTNFNQPEALSFMCSRDMIAIMPSLIENSTMAVYETLECNIPFIATNVGGTPELVAEEDRASCLISPNAHDLADRIKKALNDGQKIAHPSFNNQENLKTWYGFHAYIAEIFDKQSGRSALKKILGQPSSRLQGEHKEKPPLLEAIILLREEEGVMAFVKSLQSDPPDTVKLLFTDLSLERIAKQMSDELQAAGINTLAIDYVGFPAGKALNNTLNESTMDACIVCDGTVTQFAGGFCRDLRTAVQASQDMLITSFVALPDNTIAMPIGSDIVSEIAIGKCLGADVVCIPKGSAKNIGELLPYDIRYGLLHEYILRAGNDHGLELLVIPECLLQSSSYVDEQEVQSQNANTSYLRSMPLIENRSISYRKLSLLPSAQPNNVQLSPKLYRDKRRSNDEPVWFVHADKSRSMSKPYPKVAIGLDEKRSHLHCVALGVGARSLFVNGAEQPLILVSEKSDVSLHRFEIPANWQEAECYNIKFFLTNKTSSYVRFIRIIKISRNVFAANSGSPILDSSTIEEVLNCNEEDIIDATSNNLIDNTHISSAKQSALHKVEITQANTIPTGDSSIITPKIILGKRNEQPMKSIVRKMERVVRGYTGSPVKASIPPRELGTVNPHFIEGWAWDRSDTSRKLSVVMELNGKLVAEAYADLYIERFGTKNTKLAQHGFRLSLSPEMKIENAELIIREKESGMIVRNGRLRYLSNMMVAI